MRGILRPLLVALCIAASSGCYSYHVFQEGGGQTGIEGGNQPGTPWQGKTLHGFLYGAIRQDLPVTNCQQPSGQRFGIEEVKIEKNALHLLAAGATLGLWVPLKVSWRCQRPPSQRHENR